LLYLEGKAVAEKMFRFTYGVTTKASPSRAWQIFSNWRRWNQFANIYGELRWREGHPWQPGSRMNIEVLHPVNVVIEHVITSCVPGRQVGWIDHALGVAMAQWVQFDDQGGKGTRVHTWGDIVHSRVTIAGRSVEELISSFTETWYENFRRACDRMADPRLAEAGD
jgi:hypothetical protein